MKDFNARLTEYRSLAEESLSAFLPRERPPKSVADAMAYSLLSGGKRIRAVLLLAAYALFAQDAAPAAPFAAAVEMIHAYSLIHDDLPCMDNDDLRRGRPACHIAFGEDVALLAGDALQTLAFETICKPQNAARFGAEKTLEAVKILSAAAGIHGMVGGQEMDILNEGREVSAGMLILTDEKKTGALIAAAVEIGCVLGGASETMKACAVTYAKKLGLAFQVVDDILDETADPKRLGKPVGSDAGNHKTTYVTLYGPEKSREIVKKLTDEANSALLKTGLDIKFLCTLADTLTGREY